jgi:RNA recognition motif-containing protein
MNGLGGTYNFVYVPFDFKKSVVFRYGFVNFVQHEQAVMAMATLDGFSGWVVNGEKGCEVEWSGAQQSLHALIERYRNSPVMHDRVPDAYKPLLFERGVEIAFPAPTQAVNPPKHANQSAAQTPEVKSHCSQAKTEADTFEAPVHDSRTSLIVKNLPAGCVHDELRRILDDVGLGGLYNFIYVPFDFRKAAALRYGFVNFEQNEQAVKAIAILDGLVVAGEKSFEVNWCGDTQQSLDVHIERYRNSPLMHSSVPDVCKPVLFMRGVRIPFPAPTKVVKPLKIRRSQQS